MRSVSTTERDMALLLDRWPTGRWPRAFEARSVAAVAAGVVHRGRGRARVRGLA
jgi:hypothetical protein